MPAELVSESEQFRHADGIYPDNILTVECFLGMMTQWRMGPAGAVGLDYGRAMDRVFTHNKVSAEEEADVFDGVRVMEMSALRTMRENRGSK